MSYVQLALVKSHLAVYHDQDDTLIQQCIDAAESYAAGYMNRPAIRDIQFTPWYVGNYGADSGSSETLNTVPAEVVQAILMLAADNYDKRDSGVASGPRTDAAHNLLSGQRVGLGL